MRRQSPLPATDMLECRAILFDLDGVLVDSRAVVERTWDRWAQRHGLSATGLVHRAHGRRSVETVREFAPYLDADAEVEWLAAAELADTEGLVLLPGARAAFNTLPDSHRAVVTSGGRALARLRLGHVGLPVPTVLIAAEDVTAGKPAPDGYQLAATRLGVRSDECVVIEDTPVGIAAGHAAGARVIGVATTFPADALQEADLVVSSLAGLHIVRNGDLVRIQRET